jgi:hypothetical protein
MTTTPKPMSDYVKLTTVDHTGKRSTFLLQILSEDAVRLRGLKVNAAGDDFESHYNASGDVVEVQRLIAQGAIVRRVPMVMNLHYGTLEPSSPT